MEAIEKAQISPVPTGKVAAGALREADKQPIRAGVGEPPNSSYAIPKFSDTVHKRAKHTNVPDDH